MSKDAGHFYKPDGTPCHFVPCKTRDGERPTTIGDARKLGLYPSVTQVLKVVDKPGLRDWLIMQAVHAVVTAPDELGEGLDAKIKRVLERDREQDEQSKRARDLGSEVHAAIEEHLAGRLYAPQFKPFVDCAVAQLDSLGTVVASEKVLVHPSGYAGRTDCICHNRHITVVDFKTCTKLPQKAAWPEARMQIGAYCNALGNTGDKRVMGVLLYLSTVEPGTFALFIEEEWQEAYKAFEAAFALWRFINSYDPVVTASTMSQQMSTIVNKRKQVSTVSTQPETEGINRNNPQLTTNSK